MKTSNNPIKIVLLKEVLAAIVLATIIMGVTISVTEPYSAGVLAAIFQA